MNTPTVTAAFNSPLLITSGVALALATLLLVVVLWLDWRTLTNALNGLLTLTIALWGLGLFIQQTSADLNLSLAFTSAGSLVADLGFAAGCLALYVFAVTLSGGRNSLLLWLTLPGTLMLVAYRALLAYASGGQMIISTIPAPGASLTASEPLWAILYTILVLTTIGVVWRRRRKLPNVMLRTGILALAISLLVELIGQLAGSYGAGFPVAALSLLVINYAQVRLQVVLPLARRDEELRGFRDVGMAISSRLQLDEVLKTIAAQSAAMLGAESAAIFLLVDKTLELAAVHHLPEHLIGHHLALTDGLAGQTALAERTSRLEDYRRDWRGTPDLPRMEMAFGAVIAVPLIFDSNVLGVLFVAERPYGKRFGRSDTQLLELLAPQAAIAIANSRLFEKQRELDQLKNQMIRMTSHDLKNPLFAAMQRVELLQEEGADLLTPQMNTDLAVIETQLERMNRIIRGILDIERVQSGSLASDPLDGLLLVKEAIAEFAGQAQTRGILLCDDTLDSLSDNDALIYGDRHYLRQSLANLIDNALKFTPAEGSVRVGISHEPERIIFHVADSGIGIPIDVQPHVFERFYRTPQPNYDPTQVTGSGLGLSLVQTVVEAHNGRVWFESTSGQGTTFYIALPARISPIPALLP